MPVSLGTLAARVGGRPLRDSDLLLTQIAHPRSAGAGELSFLPAGVERYTGTAGALLIEAPLPLPPATVGIVVPQPLIACARAASWLPVRAEFAGAPDRNPPCVDPTAELAPGCIVESGASIGAYSRVGAWTRVGHDARIGDYCEVAERVSLGDGATLGNRVRVDAGTVIGADAFVALCEGGQWIRFPAFAGVTVQDDAAIGANCTIARGVFRATLIGYRANLDAQVHIGHDAEIGADTVMASGTSVGGSTAIGPGCVFGGRVAVADGLAIAARVHVTAMSLVTKSITAPATHWSGAWPVERSNAWWQSIAQWRRQVRGRN